LKPGDDFFAARPTSAAPLPSLSSSLNEPAKPVHLPNQVLRLGL
jgi:hypothetical protein